MLVLIKGITMNKLTCSAWALAICLNAHWAVAANGAKELDNNIPASEMPDQMEPTRTANDKPVMKHKMHKKSDHKKMMDRHMKDKETNGEKMTNKPMTDKQMMDHQKMESMQGGNAKAGSEKAGDDSNSMNNKPIGTSTDNPDVNTKDATNGKKY